MRQLAQQRAQFRMRRPTATQFGGHAGREDLVLLEVDIIFRHEGIIGVIRRMVCSSMVGAERGSVLPTCGVSLTHSRAPTSSLR